MVTAQHMLIHARIVLIGIVSVNQVILIMLMGVKISFTVRQPFSLLQ